MERIKLSDHFTFGRLMRFVSSSIAMMIFTSIYGVVDGLFVSNYAGKTAFAALNMIIPFPLIIGTLGFMLGTGGSAIVAKTMGEKEDELAEKYFTMIVLVTVIGGIIFSVLGEIFIEPVAVLMGADEEMMPYCIIYGRILLAGMTAFMLQNLFQSFLVTAEKPQIGLWVTVIAGVTNMVLDYVLVGVLELGITGAAVATCISQAVGGIIPLVYFFCKNDSRLHFRRTGIKMRVILRASSNGISELMTNVSLSLVTILYNKQLMKLAGEDGVAAYGVIMYISFVFVTIFIGYGIGSAPLFGYHYGAQNHFELRNLLKKSIAFIIGAGVIMVSVSIIFAGQFAGIFVGYDEELYELTKRGLILYSTAYLFNGFNIWASSFFTSLGDGVTSAIISFLRTLLFQVPVIILLPLVIGTDGIWLAVLVSEFCALIVSVSMIIARRKKFNY